MTDRVAGSFAAEVGARIKKYRVLLNVSQESLAIALDVPRNAVWRWENGRATVSLLMVMRIVGVLRIDVNCLLPGSRFVWGRELPKRPPVRWRGKAQLERDPPLTGAERAQA